MPILEYDKTTKAINAAHYGRVWDANEWTNYETNYPGKAVIFVSDANTTTHRKYLQIAEDGTGTLHDTTLMDISVNKTLDSFTNQYSLTSDNIDYIEFTEVEENATVYIDTVSIGTMDATGIFTFTAQEAGVYGIKFELLAYESIYFEVLASDNI